MKLESAAFQNNGKIPPRYTCDGENINPPLAISDVPKGAKSLALVVDDPDSPSGTWIHWLISDVEPDTTDIAEGHPPKSAREGVNSFGKSGYGGPCPHSGTHRYFFKLYALDTKLGLSTAADIKEFERAVAGHILAKTLLVGLYDRGA